MMWLINVKLITQNINTILYGLYCPQWFLATRLCFSQYENIWYDGLPYGILKTCSQENNMIHILLKWTLRLKLKPNLNSFSRGEQFNLPDFRISCREILSHFKSVVKNLHPVSLPLGSDLEISRQNIVNVTLSNTTLSFFWPTVK